jgi:hypothetical protein
MNPPLPFASCLLPFASCLLPPLLSPIFYAKRLWEEFVGDQLGADT